MSGQSAMLSRKESMMLQKKVACSDSARGKGESSGKGDPACEGKNGGKKGGM